MSGSDPMEISDLRPGSRPRPLARLPRLVLTVAACSLAACDVPRDAEYTPAEALGWAVDEIDSPAGPESGEPFLAVTGDGLLMSWLESAPEGGHRLRMAALEDGGFTYVRDVAESDQFFVNWADFPSMTIGRDGQLWVHWLERVAESAYAYGVRVAHSEDEGVTWSDPVWLHDDDSPTEHGFVTTLPLDGGGMGFVWLDGRGYAEGEDGTPATQEMGLRYREFTSGGAPGPEVVLDARVCDCCQTDAALAGSTPVVVYRDRSTGEIRDTYITRFVDGGWTEGVAVFDDGWEIGGCPVNGPAVAADGEEVVVAWFSAADDAARVKLARSSDGGVTFGPPIVVDDGDPSGRVDLVMNADGDAIVSWLERTGGDVAEVRVRLVGAGGGMSESLSVAGSSDERGSGFPRMAWAPDGRLIVAWTDESAQRVRVAALDVAAG